MAGKIEIRPFCEGDREAFRVLNEAWIEKHFGLEEKDRVTLNDPEGKILAKGGHILIAEAGGAAVGCCALLWMRPGVYEVAKMTVSESHRGRGLGRKLLEETVALGKGLGATSLYLETNGSLVDAIHLYEEVGFRHLPPERVTPSPYARANVFMEMVLG